MTFKIHASIGKWELNVMLPSGKWKVKLMFLTGKLMLPSKVSEKAYASIGGKRWSNRDNNNLWPLEVRP